MQQKMSDPVKIKNIRILKILALRIAVMHEEKPENIEILASTLIHNIVDQNIVEYFAQ
jgi:hypothetical protein